MSFYSLVEKLFPDRCREIPAMDGGILLQQIRVTKNSYLHHFLKPEPLGMFHKHRWKTMRSFVLTGSYREQRLYKSAWPDIWKSHSRSITHRFGQTFTMDKSVIHRVEYWSPWCWTWFFFGESDGDWGYYDFDLNYTPWDEYIPDEIRVKHV